MKGIESAFFGAVATETIELKTGRSGVAWAAFSVGVSTGGVTDDGKELMTWLRVTCFAEIAERVAATFKKGDRCYCEGALKLDNWIDKHGEPKHGLSVNAYKVEKVGVSALGRNKPKREIDRQFAQRDPAPYVHSGQPITASSFAGPAHRREKPRIQGLNDDRDYWRDELPI
jgi:single-stranded DNA-binding protein